MYEPGKIMACGGGGNGRKSTWVVDLTNPNGAQWFVSGDMKGAAPEKEPGRRNHDLVILPDGKVFCVGGNKSSATTDAVLETEVWDPASGQGTLQPSIHPQHQRWYHSTAILLHDGRVAACGGRLQPSTPARRGRGDHAAAILPPAARVAARGRNDEPTGQILQPPYISSGAPRPEITDAPTYMEWGESYAIDYDANEGQLV